MFYKLKAYFLTRRYGKFNFFWNFRRIFKHLLWLKRNRGKYFLLELQAAWQLKYAEQGFNIIEKKWAFTQIRSFDFCVASFRSSQRSQYERNLDQIIRRHKGKFYFF